MEHCCIQWIAVHPWCHLHKAESSPHRHYEEEEDLFGLPEEKKHNKLNKRQGSPNRNHKACINLGYPMFHAYISYLQVIMARQRLEIIDKIRQNKLNVLGNIKVIYNQKK